MYRFIWLCLVAALVPASLSAQSKLQGFVISLESGLPVAGVTVELKDNSGLAVPKTPPVHTDQPGYYQFDDLSPGQYQLRVASLFEIDGRTARYVLASSTFSVSETVQIHAGLSELAFRAHTQIPKLFLEDGRAPKNLPVMFFRSSIKDGSGKEFLTASYVEELDGSQFRL